MDSKISLDECYQQVLETNDMLLKYEQKINFIYLKLYMLSDKNVKLPCTCMSDLYDFNVGLCEKCENKNMIADLDKNISIRLREVQSLKFDIEYNKQRILCLKKNDNSKGYINININSKLQSILSYLKNINLFKCKNTKKNEYELLIDKNLLYDDII